MPVFQTFDDIETARTYADKCWTVLLARRAHEGDGTLSKPEGGKITVPIELATIDALDVQPVDAATFKVIPLYGRDHTGKTVVDHGLTLRWAESRETAKGRWAIECLPGDDGEPEPEWPPPTLVVEPVQVDDI